MGWLISKKHRKEKTDVLIEKFRLISFDISFLIFSCRQLPMTS